MGLDLASWEAVIRESWGSHINIYTRLRSGPLTYCRVIVHNLALKIYGGVLGKTEFHGVMGENLDRSFVYETQCSK